jgi:hypothetical protein
MSGAHASASATSPVAPVIAIRAPNARLCNPECHATHHEQDDQPNHGDYWTADANTPIRRAVNRHRGRWFSPNGVVEGSDLWKTTRHHNGLDVCARRERS